MTEACLAEGNANFQQWLEEIALGRPPGTDPVLTWFFLRAAVRLRRRGYLPASMHALALYRRYADTSPLRKAFNGIFIDRYFSVCDRPWATFVPRLVRVLSDRENLAAHLRRRLRSAG